MFLISDSDISVAEVNELEFSTFHFRHTESQNRQIQAIDGIW